MEPSAAGTPGVAFVAAFAYVLALHLATAGTLTNRLVGTALVAVAVGLHLLPFRLRLRVSLPTRVRLARIAWAVICFGGTTLIVLARRDPDVGLETLAAGYGVTLYFVPVLLDERLRRPRWFALGILVLLAVSIHFALTNVEWFGGSGFG